VAAEPVNEDDQRSIARRRPSMDNKGLMINRRGIARLLERRLKKDAHDRWSESDRLGQQEL